MAKEEVYIKDGVILRGNKATKELAKKDAEEVIRESRLESHIKRKAVTLRLRKPGFSSSAKMCKTDTMSVNATGLSASGDLGRGEATAHGIKVKALTATGEGLSVKGTLRAFGEVVGAQLKAATMEGQALDFGFSGEVGTSLRAMDVKGLNTSVTGVRSGGHVSSTATAKLVDAKVVNANATGVEIAAEAEASVSAKVIDTKIANADVAGLVIATEAGATAAAKGADIKAANVRVAGAEITARAEAKAEATGLEVNAANAKVVGYKKHTGAGVSAQAKGMEVKAGTANIAWVEEKREVTAEVKAVGKQVEVANIKLTGKKEGASAKAKVEAQGAKVQVANVNVEAQDSSISASANLNVAAASARVANVNITPLDGAHFHATADVSPGIDAFNVQVGTHKGAGVGVSTKLQVGNVCLSAGPPNLRFGPGLNLGFGGNASGSGKQSGGGSSSEGTSYTTEGRHRLEKEFRGKAHPGTSMAHQTGTGRGEHKSHHHQSTTTGSAVGGKHVTKDNEQLVSSGAHTASVHEAYSDEDESNDGEHYSSKSGYVANSSGHIASTTEHKASSSRYQTRDGKYYGSSTGKEASARRRTATAAEQGNITNGFRTAENGDSSTQAASLSRHMRTKSTTNSGRRTVSGESRKYTKDIGHRSGTTGYETNGSGHWTVDGEHDLCCTTTSSGHCRTRLKGCKNTSEDHDSSEFGRAIRSNASTGISTTWKPNIDGDKTTRPEQITGQAVKSSKSMTSSMEHKASHMATSSGGCMEYENGKHGYVTTNKVLNIGRMGQVAKGSGRMPTDTEHRLSRSGHKEQSSRPTVRSTEHCMVESGQVIKSGEDRCRVSDHRITSGASDMKSASKRNKDTLMRTEHHYSVSGDEKKDAYSVINARQTTWAMGHVASGKGVPGDKQGAHRNEQMMSKPTTEEEMKFSTGEEGTTVTCTHRIMTTERRRNGSRHVNKHNVQVASTTERQPSPMANNGRNEEKKMEEKARYGTTEGEHNISTTAKNSDHLSSHGTLMNTCEGSTVLTHGSTKPYSGDDHMCISEQCATHQSPRKVHAEQNSKYERNGYSYMQQCSESATTSHRNDPFSDPDYQHKMPVKRSGSVTDPRSNFTDSVQDHEFRMPSNDGKEDERPENKEAADYKRMLAAHVSEYVQLPDSKKRKEKEKKVLPQSRQEAKREMIRQLRMVHQQSSHESRTMNDDFDASGDKEGKKNDGGPQTEGASGKDKNTTEGDDDTLPKPKEKPFGSNKNIFTLGCFQNESSKKVKKVSGTVHGFEA